MDRIVDHVLAFEGEGKIKDFVGNFSEYREWKKNQDKNKIQQTKFRKYKFRSQNLSSTLRLLLKRNFLSKNNVNWKQ
jgi:ATPase subunit of ABC transporter with duplicated ATPase domains